MKKSLPTLIVLKTIANIVIVLLMNRLLPNYFVVLSGGIAAFVLIGIVIGFLNVLVRPILFVLTLPLKIFLSIVATILVNAGILWLTVRLTWLMDPSLIRFEIQGGIVGWVIVSVIFGLLNWLLKQMLPARTRSE